MGWAEWTEKKNMGDHKGAEESFSELFSEEAWEDIDTGPWKKLDSLLSEIIGTDYFCKECRESGNPDDVKCDDSDDDEERGEEEEESEEEDEETEEEEDEEDDEE
jgi:hypothetical protein